MSAKDAVIPKLPELPCYNHDRFQINFFSRNSSSLIKGNNYTEEWIIHKLAPSSCANNTMLNTNVSQLLERRSFDDNKFTNIANTLSALTTPTGWRQRGFISS